MVTCVKLLCGTKEGMHLSQFTVIWSNNNNSNNNSECPWGNHEGNAFPHHGQPGRKHWLASHVSLDTGRRQRSDIRALVVGVAAVIKQRWALSSSTSQAWKFPVAHWSMTNVIPLDQQLMRLSLATVADVTPCEKSHLSRAQKDKKFIFGL